MPNINKGERNKRGSGARMKKEYVKPVIESEEFVANEYVAACWWVTCNPERWQDILGRHNQCEGYSTRVGEEEPQLRGGFGLVGNNWYDATINGNTTTHPVTSEDRSSETHPNASA